ncbi:hypothetical protein [Streptomyces sp. NPDC048002]|uniref:hypothetical protein n=1 Tax=unclassified Streptomyces TaxID=2593676 RepID=UPI0033CFBB1A
MKRHSSAFRTLGLGIAGAVAAAAMSTGAAIAVPTTGTAGTAVTPAQYIAYLEGQNSPEALEVLAEFKALAPDEQSKFVGYLNDPEVFKAFLEYSGESQGQNATASTTGEKRVTKYNQDVIFVNEGNVTRERSGATRDVTWTEKATYTFKQKLLGVTVTKMTVWVRYSASRGAVEKALNSGSALKNFNIGVDIDGDNARPWVSGGRAHAETVWKGELTYSGYTARIDKIQHLSAAWDGTWKGSTKNA